MTRISKYLAQCGLGSRRKCEKLVLQGSIKVNRKTVKDLAFQVKPQDQVTYAGQQLQPQPKRVVAVNKPAGYLCTLKDDFGRKIVTDLVKEDVRLYPVGRLDYRSRGLLIMTNDGNLSYKLTHPKFRIPKTYKVKVKGTPRQSVLNQIRQGICIEGTEVAVTSLKVGPVDKGCAVLTIEIAEGRKRIIRRLLEKKGFEVVDLQRIKIGNFALQGLKEGHYRVLQPEEIKALLAPAT